MIQTYQVLHIVCLYKLCDHGYLFSPYACHLLSLNCSLEHGSSISLFVQNQSALPRESCNAIDMSPSRLGEPLTANSESLEQALGSGGHLASPTLVFPVLLVFLTNVLLTSGSLFTPLHGCSTSYTNALVSVGRDNWRETTVLIYFRLPHIKEH